MKRLWDIIGDLLYRYGASCASVPSRHGSYEAPVPEKLRFKEGK